MGLPQSGLPWKLYHDLWTSAVGQPGYNKNKWQTLGRILFQGYDERIKLDLESIYERERSTGNTVEPTSPQPIKSCFECGAGMALSGTLSRSELVDRLLGDHLRSDADLKHNAVLPAEDPGDSVRAEDGSGAKTIPGKMAHGKDDLIERHREISEKIYSRHTMATTDGTNLSAAITVLSEVIRDGLEKLDKPRFIVQSHPLWHMDPTGHEGVHRHGKPVKDN
jgi:hypothetical protein